LLQGTIRAIVYAVALVGAGVNDAKTGIVLGDARLHVGRQCGGYNQKSREGKAHVALLGLGSSEY
jgi:hypothetical protein